MQLKRITARSSSLPLMCVTFFNVLAMYAIVIHNKGADHTDFLGLGPLYEFLVFTQSAGAMSLSM